MSPFRLYPHEQHWWTFRDYRAVLDVTMRVRPKRVLEFGPGSSTLALIEGGAHWIDTCEDDAHYAGVYRIRLQDVYPRRVQLHPYTWADPLTIPAVDAHAYDLALIDGPADTERRTAVITYCLARSAYVLVPLEETPELDGRGFLREFISGLVNFDVGRVVTWTRTGSLAGSFALFHPAQ